jgi:hypothetical protein
MRLARSALVIALLTATVMSACGKSGEQIEREKMARQAAMQKALENSIAEEREKDRRMREAATQQANDRIDREAAAHEIEVARAAAQAIPVAEQERQAERANALRRYTDKLIQALGDTGPVQLHKAELSPKQNGMCAEFNAKTKAGSYAGFKRVVVTDSRVTIEEPPTRDTLTQFLVFQIAARDTGCFPDVEKVRILQ